MNMTIEHAIAYIKGEQDGSIVTRDRRGVHTMAITAGPLHIQCHSYAAVRSHAEAWSVATEEISSLPVHSHNTAVAATGLITITQHRAADTALWHSLDAADYPLLEVRVGGLHVRAWDQTSVLGMHDIWSRALRLARTYWAPASEPLHPDIVKQSRRERGLPAIAKHGLPPALV